MSIIVADAAEIDMLEYIVGKTTTVRDVVLKLFTNNITPGSSDTEASFTEAAGGGYAAKTLTGASWSISTNGSGQAEATYAQQTWTFTGALSGGATIYGYYAVKATDGTLLWAQRADAPFTPANNGDTYKVTPKFQLASIN